MIAFAKLAFLKARKIIDDLSSVHARTLAACQKAYAPYSGLRVGALLKAIGHDEAIEGCNVENASYPAGICAERNALFASVSKWGKISIEWVAVVTDGERSVCPCGMCLQAMAEFAREDFPVYLGNRRGIEQTFNFSQLLPHRFDGESLGRTKGGSSE